MEKSSSKSHFWGVHCSFEMEFLKVPGPVAHQPGIQGLKSSAARRPRGRKNWTSRLLRKSGDLEDWMGSDFLKDNCYKMGSKNTRYCVIFLITKCYKCSISWKIDTTVIRSSGKPPGLSDIPLKNTILYHPQIIITINPWANHHGIPNGWFASGPAESASHNNCRALASSPLSSKAASKARKVTSPSVAQGQAEENMGESWQPHPTWEHHPTIRYMVY